MADVEFLAAAAAATSTSPPAAAPVARRLPAPTTALRQLPPRLNLHVDGMARAGRARRCSRPLGWQHCRPLPVGCP